MLLKFSKKTILFITPVLLLLTVPVVILSFSREGMFSLDELINKHDKYLVGYAYHERNYQYLKYETIIRSSQNAVMVMGSSRALQFRDKMFDTTFYNAGFTVTSLADFKPSLLRMPKSKYPKYLIIALDQWMFNASWDQLKPNSSLLKNEEDFIFYPEMGTLKKVYLDLAHHKIDLKKVVKQDRHYIGLHAALNSIGFRNDGSFFYGDNIVKLLRDDPAANDFGFRDTREDIRRGRGRFKYGAQINPAAISELQSFLEYCHENGITVVGFLPPFADEVYTAMIESGNYNYLKDLYHSVDPAFRKYDFEWYDFSTLSRCHSSDREAVDGFHGGELTYLRMLITMLESGSVLNAVCDLEKIKADALTPENRYVVYTY